MPKNDVDIDTLLGEEIDDQIDQVEEVDDIKLEGDIILDQELEPEPEPYPEPVRSAARPTTTRPAPAPSPAAPVSSPPAPRVQQSERKVSRAEMESDEELSNMPGIVVGDLGTRVSRNPLERKKFSAQKKERIAIISSKVIAIKKHYNKDLGSYLCFGGACCKVDDRPRVVYLFPIIIYDTDYKGGLIPNSESFQLSILALSQDQYEAILDIHSAQAESGGILRIDLLVSCLEDNFQKLTFTPFAPQNYWRRYPDVVRPLLAYWQENRKYAYLASARQITPQQFAEKITRTDEPVTHEATPDFDMDDMLK